MFNFFSEIKKEFDLSDDFICGIKIINIGFKLIYIEGKIEIIKAEENHFVLKYQKKLIFINGKNLEIKEFSEGTIVIVGEDICVCNNLNMLVNND